MPNDASIFGPDINIWFTVTFLLSIFGQINELYKLKK
jgi:hypothetical protein